MKILRILAIAALLLPLFACTSGSPVEPEKSHSGETVCTYDWATGSLVCVLIKNPLDT